MATRHELIHIDFVANAGKANPVLKSLQVSCNDARIAKEQLDAQLKDAKAMNAPAEVIANLEKKLKSQTTTWQQLERGLREYTKGIDTLSKGIKEFNDGTLDDMSAKFNKAVYNAAKLAQSAVKTGSGDWNQLQRLMDATDRNVTRAREDIDLMMQSLRDGSAVSTVQLTRSREVLEDLARLAVTNSEEWRGLRKQFNEVDAAIASVTETEKRLKGEIATENDAIALSNSLTKESIALRHADGEAAMKAAQTERKGVEDTMRGISDRIVLLTKERDGIQDEIELQENLNDIIKERDEKILSAQNRKQDAEQRKAQAQATIKEYDEQEKKVQELKLQKKDLEEQQKKETREAEKSAKATEEQNKKQAELTQTVSTLKGEIGGLETSLQGLEEQIKKTSAEPVKPKVDTSKIEELQAKLKAVQDGIAEKNAQIEAESRKGGLANKWQETLTRLQGDKDGRLSPMGLGDDKKQMDDILDVANNFYEIIKKVKGVTEDKFIPAQAAEPIKQLAEYYKITEEEARKLVKTLQQSEVISKRFATFDYNEQTGFLAINKNTGKDDQQVRIEAAQSYMKAAERREGDLTEKVNKLLADKKKLEEEEVEIKGKLQAATEGVAVSTDKSSSATERRVNLTKKEKEEVKKLTDENNSLTGTIDALKKQLDSLSVSQGKATESIKDGAEAAKGEAEAMKMTAEEAKEALAKMTDVGTVKATKDGPLEASNLEGAQQALFGIFKNAGAAVGNGVFTLSNQDQIRKAVKAFQDKFHIDDDKYAKELMTKLAIGKNGGLISQGISDVDPITHKPLLQISRDEGAWKERLRQQQEYRDIMAGVTTATREQTAADKAQEEVVKSLREAYQREKDALARRNEEYQKRLRQAESMSGSAKKEDGTLTAKGVELEKAEEYRQKYVVKQQEKERKAWEEYQAAKSGNIDVEKSRKQIEEQILTLEQQKAANTERLTQLQEKGAKATKEQVKADGEAVTTGKNMNELLQEKERITARLTEKQAKLKKAQEDLAKMTKEETAAGKEQSSVTEELTKKTEEYNAETEKLANMKEGRNKARGVIRNADRSISNADDAIATLKNEPLPQRKSEAEVGSMKKRVAELTAEVEKETAAFNKNAQAITELNKKETQAAIEMAQSENVSIEKVKQSIELLQKKIQTEATDTDTMKQRGEAINRLSERLTQMNAEVANLSKPIADRLNTEDLGKLSETEIRQGIDAAKELLKTYEVGGDKAKELTNNIARADQYLRDNSVEAARQTQKEAAQLQLMTDRIQDVSKLSASAVTETKRFWEAMVAGAERGSKELAEYEGHLKTITEEEQKRAIEQARSQAFRVKAGLFTTMDENELRESINAAREYQKTLMVGGTLYNEYSEAIAKAEKHLRDNSVETERAKLSQQEMNSLMRQQLDQGTALTESALRAQQQYWQRLIDDPKTAAESLDLYKANLKEVQDLQQQQANELRDTRAARLDNPGNFSNLSEQEIREAIEAGKQLIQTYETGDARAKTLGENIVRAEEHLKQYGLEAARTAQREADALEKANKAQQERIGLMVKQWNETRSTMSESALKNHERFWQQLIDDPKTAAESLDWYRENLAKVQREIENHRANIVQNEGVAAFGFFERGDDANASADEVKRQADALKKYRDSLPKQDEAETIAKINEHLQRVGQSAEKASEDVMSLDDALKLAEGAGGEGFLASPQQIQSATKALNERRDAVIKLIQTNKALGNSTDAEEAELADLTKKLRDLKYEQDNYNMSQEKMQMLMKTPTNAVNLEELRAAIKRADAELRRMEGSLDENSDKYKELAADVKNAKGILKEMEGQAKATTSAFDKAWSRLKTYVGLYVGASVAMNKLMGTIGDIHELSDKMGEVRKTTGFTADEVGRLSTNLKQLDTRTGLTSLMETAAKAGQLGLKSLEDVQGFTQAANMLMVALPEMGQEAATEMLKVALATGEVKKIQDQINKGLIEGSSATEVAMTKIGSTIDQLRANSAAAAPQITDFVKRVGAVGAQSGISIDQVAALGATVDALGMRVEMSATALSRMIPAIRNNAFELAKAIGVTPETVRNLFDTGRGMEVILMIFDRIKESGMDADSIENMLGMAGMKDIMKDLNQQGARAGIVFAGLSQNVDELRRNLRTAGEAYEENIAILNEYNKMNDTTAAKWERLKNQVEELFVGDTAQRWFGYIITGMRWIVDLLTSGNGISAGLRIIIVYLGLVKANIGGILVGIKSCGGGLKGIAMWLGIIDKQTKKMAWGNIFTALAMAALYAWHELSNLKTALEKADEALGKTKEEVGRAQVRFDGYYQKLKSTSETLQQARISHDKLSAEVDKLRQSTDKSATATDNLKKKEDELKKSEDKVTQASRDHKSAISDMNSIYGKYLGFILTETNYANLAAAAHDKVTAAIEREMLMKQRQAAIGDVDSQYAQDIATGYGKLNERLVSYGKLERREASQAMSDLQKFLRENVRYDSGTNQAVVSKAVTEQLKKSGLDLSKATADEVVALWYDKYLKENYHISDNVRRGITGVERRRDMDEGWGTVYTPFSTNLRGGYASTYVQREQQRGAVSAVYDTDITRSEGEEAKAAGKLLSKLEQQAKQAKKSILDKNTNDKDRNVAYGELANALEGLENRINELNPQQDAETINRLRDMAKSLSSSGIDVKKLKKAREEIHATLFERATFNEDTIKNLDTSNPWGSALGAESTDWKNMTAEQLVNRRKQMKDFVNAIQTDTDVQSVLKEDAALKKAIEKGMSADMRTVIEWYNTERLKIQDELHARHLTNTGDWMDPKKQKNAHKQFQNEVKAYLEELDAYYTERNQKIQDARNNEEITEGEAWRRTIKNETEWHNRRAELQKLYAEKGAEVTKEEQDAIFAIIAERTGDDEKFIRQMIQKTIGFAKEIEKTGEKGAAIVHKWRADLGLGWERDYLKSAQSIGKQMKFIEDTLAKERPYDGITKNLQENLDKMGVLAAQYKRINDELEAAGKEKKYSDAEITAQTYKEMAFYLRQAEDAWSIDIDELLRRMAEEGMATTAEEISKSDMLKQAVMGQLRKTFEDVQNAVKKEASQIKKDVDIIWNDDTRGPGGMSMKATFDKAIARLGMQQDSVSRANGLIGAGMASDNVATRLAMKQIEVQMRMQKAQYDMYRVQASQRITALKAEAAEHERIAKQMKQEGNIMEAERENLAATNALRDAENVKRSLGLTLAEETKKEEEQKAELLKIQEESQNRLYQELRSWADLLSSSLQGLFEASHAGDAEYYNERAKMDLTGNGGPGAGTYIVIEDEGTDDARAHYEYLDERQALERQREIENDNAVAEAWKKVMDDLNQKMSDTITDQLNAMLQSQSIDANTQAVIANTEALWAQLGQGGSSDFSDAGKLKRNAEGMAVDESGQPIAPIQPTEQTGETPAWKPFWQMTEEEKEAGKESLTEMAGFYRDLSVQTEAEKAELLAENPDILKPAWQMTEEDIEAAKKKTNEVVQSEIDADKKKTDAKIDNNRKEQQSTDEKNKKEAASTQSTYSKMAAAVNMYGIAYQTMSNDNMSASQKFQMFALQSAGQVAISMLTTDMLKTEGEAAVELPGIFGKAVSSLGPIAGPIAFAAMTALLGGLMGVAVSKIAKSKSQISQVTGASMNAGRLSTGMLTYAEGNVNEFTDPSTLTPGRSYNVDAADGRTYRAKYTGTDPKTHITSGPEFHLVGERGQEAIIDAKTTRQIRMDDNGIWQSIQTLYNGGRLSASRRRRSGMGVRAFAEGNMDEFEEIGSEAGTGDGGAAGMGAEQMAAFQSSLDRNNELLERALTDGIHARFDVYGKGGLIDSYDTGKKTVSRHGEKY